MGGGGTPSACEGLLGSLDACSSCVEANCCPDLDACVTDANCNGYLVGDGDFCPNDPLFETLDACVNAACMSECTASNECNPVTNEGCFSSEACDLENAFTCFPPPHDVPLCEECDSANGPWCSAGATCTPETKLCGRYCCADTDCGTGVCNFDLYHDPNVGICVVQVGGYSPACDAPAVSPSGGPVAEVRGEQRLLPDQTEGALGERRKPLRPDGRNAQAGDAAPCSRSSARSQSGSLQPSVSSSARSSAYVAPFAPSRRAAPVASHASHQRRIASQCRVKERMASATGSRPPDRRRSCTAFRIRVQIGSRHAGSANLGRAFG